MRHPSVRERERKLSSSRDSSVSVRFGGISGLEVFLLLGGVRVVIFRSLYVRLSRVSKLVGGLNPAKTDQSFLQAPGVRVLGFQAEGFSLS